MRKNAGAVHRRYRIVTFSEAMIAMWIVMLAMFCEDKSVDVLKCQVPSVENARVTKDS